MNEVLLWAGVLGAAAGFGLAAIGTAFIRRIATRRNFVDHPGGHKRHLDPVALGGGIAITFALVAPIVVGCGALLVFCRGADLPPWLPEAVHIHVPGLLSKADAALGIAAGALLLHAMGIVDDKKHLSPWIKLFVQIAVAAMLVVGFDVRMLSMLGTVPSCVATVLWIVLITNSFNFLDNMDGLSAGVAAIAAAIFALSAIRADQVFVPTLAFLLVGVAVPSVGALSVTTPGGHVVCAPDQAVGGAVTAFIAVTAHTGNNPLLFDFGDC